MRAVHAPPLLATGRGGGWRHTPERAAGLAGTGVGIGRRRGGRAPGPPCSSSPGRAPACPAGSRGARPCQSGEGDVVAEAAYACAEDRGGRDDVAENETKPPALLVFPSKGRRSVCRGVHRATTPVRPPTHHNFADATWFVCARRRHGCNATCPSRENKLSECTLALVGVTTILNPRHLTSDRTTPPAAAGRPTPRGVARARLEEVSSGTAVSSRTKIAGCFAVVVSQPPFGRRRSYAKARRGVEGVAVPHCHDAERGCSATHPTPALFLEPNTCF
jgi:hypothetical protein